MISLINPIVDDSDFKPVDFDNDFGPIRNPTMYSSPRSRFRSKFDPFWLKDQKSLLKDRKSQLKVWKSLFIFKNSIYIEKVDQIRPFLIKIHLLESTLSWQFEIQQRIRIDKVD